MAKEPIARTVERHCIEVEKIAHWHKVHTSKIVSFQPFIAEHDFSQDDVYLKASANLSGRDIEWCKARIAGYSPYQAVRQIHPAIRPQYAKQVSDQLSRREDLRPVLQHFTELWSKYHNPLSFSPVEAIETLISDYRAAPAGRMRFQMARDLIDILDIRAEVILAAKDVLPLEPAVKAGELSNEDFIAAMMKNGKLRRDPPENQYAEPPDAAN